MIRRLFLIASSLAALTITSLSAMAQEMPSGIVTAETSRGKIFTDAKGMTLYIFDKDSSGSSSCIEQCALNWPPVKVADGATTSYAGFSVIARIDGVRQWAYHGQALYSFVKDMAPGDFNGENFRDLWHIAKP